MCNNREPYTVTRAMQFADLDLSRRLERAEGQACLEFAEARRRLHPESGAEWMECAGAYAVFDGVNSPATQTFGLGLFEPLTPESLDRIEAFFRAREAPVLHEVSPLAGIAAIDLLCSRGYRPVELSSVLHQPVVRPPSRDDGARNDHDATVRVAEVEEAELWSRISALGWAHEHPEMLAFMQQLGPIVFGREHSINFLAESRGEPGAAGALCLHEGVALFAGASTIPAMRRRGLQGLLLGERMRYAFDHGYSLAMMVTEAGSQSQRNAERIGFRIAYTRTKWRLFPA